MIRLLGHTDRVLSLAFSPDGSTLISGGSEHAIRVWDPFTGEERAEYRPRHLAKQERGVRSLSFAPDGRTFALADGRKEVEIRDAATGTIEQVIRGNPARSRGNFTLDVGRPISASEVKGVFHLADGRFFSVSESEVVSWDLATGKPKSLFLSSDGSIKAFAGAAGFGEIASITTLGAVILWDEARSVDRLRESRFNPNRWQLEPGESMYDPNIPTVRPVLDGGEPHTLAMTPEGRVLAVGGYLPPAIRLIDPVSGKLLRTLEGHEEPVLCLAVSPDGATLVSGSEDGSVRFWEVETGRERGKWQFKIGWIESLAFSPDGTTLAAGGEEIVIWDMEEESR